MNLHHNTTNKIMEEIYCSHSVTTSDKNKNIKSTIKGDEQ